MIGTISAISAVVGLVASLISLFTIIFGYIKNLKKIREGMKAMLRSEIEHAYYKHAEDKTLKEYERKNIDSLYQAYHDGLHGNSFCTDIYEEMRDWKITR